MIQKQFNNVLLVSFWLPRKNADIWGPAPPKRPRVRFGAFRYPSTSFRKGNGPVLSTHSKLDFWPPLLGWQAGLAATIFVEGARNSTIDCYWATVGCYENCRGGRSHV